MRAWFRRLALALGAVSLGLGCAAGSSEDSGSIGSGSLDSGGGATHDRAGDDVSYEAGDDTSQAPNDDGGDDADDGGRTAPEGGPSPGDAGASDGLAPPADSGGDVFFTPDTGTVSPICDSNPKYAAEAELEFDEGMENTICTMGACAASECCYEPATPPCAGCSNLCLPR